MNLLDQFASITPVEALKHSRLIDPECLEILERLPARKLMRPLHRQAQLNRSK